MNEIWADVANFEGYYQVSNLGRFRSLDRKVKCRGEGFRSVRGKIRENLRPNRDGHVQIELRKENKPIYCYLHRLVLETFVGKCPEGLEARHLDGNGVNNRLDNLVWGTKKENQNDRKAHGTDCCGERSNHHKLTEEQARKIKYTNLSLSKLAKEFGVCYDTAYAIRTGRNWRHI
ncbi:MAG: NUMOD4 motif-containing HNH endonuclease [Candidatus Thorarchaeota archaeon]|jgi:hypothetical protein